MKVIPFKAHHVGLMDLRGADYDLLSSSPEVARLSAVVYERNGSGWTGLVHEGVLGAAGVVKILPGTYEAWCYSTPLVEKYKIDFHRTVRTILNTTMESGHIRRLQCMVDSKNVRAERWAHSLGFTRESTFKQYGPDGQDFYMYVRMKKDL